MYSDERCAHHWSGTAGRSGMEVWQTMGRNKDGIKRGESIPFHIIFFFVNDQHVQRKNKMENDDRGDEFSVTRRGIAIGWMTGIGGIVVIGVHQTVG